MTQTPPEPQLPPPGFAQPPAYVSPAGDAMPVQMHYAAAPNSRNVLGILALIAPFVGFSAVGIVLGHLGLSAVKKGTANNREIALAGTIVSWVFTLLFVLGIIAAIAIPIYLSQQTTSTCP